MAPSRKICVIANPAAGHGRSRALLPQVQKLLHEYGVKFDLFVTEGPKHAEFLAAKLVKGDYRAIAAMGGDGTLGEVANGVLAAGQKPMMPLAVIPAGTGNDFVTGNKLFSDWTRSIQALAQASVKYFDVLRVKDAAGRIRYAVNSLGVGFDAYVCKRVAESGSKRLGKSSYAVEVIKGLFLFQPEQMTVDTDGERQIIEKAWLCAVVNSENLGGGMKIAPGAAAQDGHLHLAYLFNTSRLSLIPLLFSVFKGTHVGKPGIHVSQALEIVIHAPETFPCHFDGDLIEALYPLHIEAAPAIIPFLTSEEN